MFVLEDYIFKCLHAPTSFLLPSSHFLRNIISFIFKIDYIIIIICVHNNIVLLYFITYLLNSL